MMLPLPNIKRKFKHGEYVRILKMDYVINNVGPGRLACILHYRRKDNRYQVSILPNEKEPGMIATAWVYGDQMEERDKIEDYCSKQNGPNSINFTFKREMNDKNERNQRV